MPCTCGSVWSSTTTRLGVEFHHNSLSVIASIGGWDAPHCDVAALEPPARPGHPPCGWYTDH
ncbi:MAG TPA: hypothetical protein VNT24_10460, partial [Propionibacteriaceae bacterium]|nr:hypothetical protein [Propionibacteriaceae bacterium]